MQFRFDSNKVFSLVWVCILLFSLPATKAVPTVKERCTTCRGLVDKFMEGIKKTQKSGFGGGNTHWEEKSLGTYVHSETRFIEISEKACDAKECHHMYEEYEEDLENWWFKEFAKNTGKELFEYFCINKVKVCCPKNTWGPECKDCTGGREKPCLGNGNCDGEGTRSGTGKCSCSTGYEGDLCEECKDGHYEAEKNETYTRCEACHKSCKDTCSEEGPKGCDECKTGWEKTDEEGCKDIDECKAEKSPCSENEHCTNNEGSYTCTACDSACKGCTGSGADNCVECSENHIKDGNSCLACDRSCKNGCSDTTPKGCTECKDGFSWTDENGCKDINECTSGAANCNENQFCTNTEGSFECFTCDAACAKCTAGGADNCTQCNTGYEKINETCTDVDECSADKYCKAENEKCVNTVGGFKCDCMEGFLRKDNKCQPKPKDKKKKKKKKNKKPKKEDKEENKSASDASDDDSKDVKVSIDLGGAASTTTDQSQPPAPPAVEANLSKDSPDVREEL